MRIIGVIGGRNPSQEALKEAEEVGRLIARRGAILVCGGLEGIMEAACRGADSEGGITVGILPTDSIEHANPYVRVPIATGLGTARNVIIVNTADALIAINGSYGTLSEIAFALQFGKPVVGLHSWQIEGMIFARNAHEAVQKVFDALQGPIMV